LEKSSGDKGQGKEEAMYSDGEDSSAALTTPQHPKLKVGPGVSSSGSQVCGLHTGLLAGLLASWPGLLAGLFLLTV